jgi:hypothetical protein
MEQRCYSKGIWFKLAEQVFHGCAAGRGFVYIKDRGIASVVGNFLVFLRQKMSLFCIL